MIQSLSLVGKKKTAKTSVALSAPLPMVFFDFELGVKRVEPRFLPDMSQVTVHKMVPASPLAVRNNPQLAEDFWGDLLTRYNQALEDDRVNTVVFDTFSAVWEARRLAYVAELRKTDPNRKNLMPQEYFVPNTDMKQLLVQAQLHGKVLVVTHHTKERYEEVTDMMGKKQGKPTGEEEPDGFKYTGDLVDVELWMSKQGGKPVGEIRTCGLSMSAEGITVPEPSYQKLDEMIEGFRNIGSS